MGQIKCRQAINVLQRCNYETTQKYAQRKLQKRQILTERQLILHKDYLSVKI